MLAVQYDLGANSGTYQNAYYDKPYTRMAPYTLGLLLGMALRDTNLKRIRLSTPVAFLAQFFCVSMIVFLFYIQVRQLPGPSVVPLCCHPPNVMMVSVFDWLTLGHRP